MEQFIGKFISLNCGDSLGVFQGQIRHVDPCSQKITLQKVFHNGCPYNSREVTISAENIKSLDMIDASSEPPQNNSVKIKKPVAKKASDRQTNALLRESPKKHFDEKVAPHGDAIRTPSKREKMKQFWSGSEDITFNAPNTFPLPNDFDFDKVNTKTPNKKEKQKQRGMNKEESAFGSPIDSHMPPDFEFEKSLTRSLSKKDKQRQRWISRDEAAFGSPIDHHISTDFDFEKNLALFNKKAVYEEINASRPDVVRQTDKKSGKYRCDENILNSKPVIYRQLIVPHSDNVEYVTDSGLIVPSLTPDLRQQVMELTERIGLSFEKQAELMGRAATEMALLLLGGAHRLNPQNQHQCPSVVILCGSNRAGALGVNCARQLATHGVRTTVYSENTRQMCPEMHMELILYRRTTNKVTTNLQSLCTTPVDLIILALLNSNDTNSGPPHPAVLWASENRAQVLALDPPPTGTPGVSSNFSLIPGLPLSYESNNGKIYLCNTAIPLQVFKEAGINYVPPFGPKFVIPLYPNDI